MNVQLHSKKNKISFRKYFPAKVINYYAAGMFFALFASLFEMVRPELIARVIDRLAVGTADIPNVSAWLLVNALAVAGVTLLSQVFRYIYQMNTVKAGESFVKHMRDMLFGHILKLPQSWHSGNQTGDMIQRCTMDINEIKNFLSEQMVNILTMLITIVFAMICLLRKSLPLAGFAFLSIPVMVLFSYWFHERIGSAFLACDEQDSRLSVIAQDNLTGIRVVRAFGGERRERARFAEANIKATDKWIDLDKYLCLFWCVSDMLGGAIMLGYLVIGSVLCVRSGLTIGNFVASIYYLIILIQPVRNMGRALSEMSKADVSINRIDEIMRVPEEQDDECVYAEDEVRMNQDICFSHVDFAYPDGTGKVLKDVSFTIKAGETFGILGNTGSGKSTIAELLTGMYEISGGSITIGGSDIRRVAKSQLRRNVGLVHQEGFLFSRSIRDNLIIGHEGIAQEDVDRAVEAACFTENVRRFPQGLDTYVGERGVTLSGGQRQRAVIARTLLLDTPILIFDDALSAVDTRTDAQIRENLKQYRKDRTVIFISHRIDTLMDSDHILVLEDGRVVEEGTHEELMKNAGLYARVAEIQHTAEYR